MKLTLQAIFFLFILSLAGCNPFKDYSIVNLMQEGLIWENGTTAYNLGDVGIGSIKSKTFILTNKSNLRAINCETPYLTNSTDFTIDSTTCTSEMEPFASCEVVILASPQSQGLKDVNIVRSCDLDSNRMNPVTAATVNAILTDLVWAPLTNDFGTVAVSANTSETTFTLTNNGSTTTSSCSAASLSNTTDFEITEDNCGTNNLAPAATCTVKVKGHPQSTGVKTATLIRDCGVGGTVSTTSNMIKVTGAISNLAWSPLTRIFGNVGVNRLSTTKTFTLTNATTSPVTGCSAPILTNLTDFMIDTDNCGTNNLAVSSSCTVRVRANAQSVGLKTTTLSRTCTSGGTVTTTLDAITATAVPPILTWDVQAKDFGDVGVSTDSSGQNFTLTNSSTLTHATGCSAPVLSNTTDFRIDNDTCSNNNVNSSNGTCNLTVVAQPQSLGVKTATLSRTCSVGGTVSTTTNAITVNGIFVIPPSLAWSDQSHHFGSIQVGVGSTLFSTTLNNSGFGSATGCSAPTLSDNINFKIVSDTCGSSDLASLMSCTVYIFANPTSDGSKTTTLSRTCSSGGTTSTLSNQITATGYSAPQQNHFTSCPAVNTSADFKMPTTCVETLSSLPMNSIAPFDMNSGSTASYTLTGSLPTGLSFNTTTGLIDGTPTGDGVYNLQICRSPGSPNCQDFTLSVRSENPIDGPLTTESLLCTATSGTGTNGDPILIDTISDLNTCVRNYWGRSFKLNADLDFAGNQIIGLPDFRGLFDGQNHILNNWNNSEPLFATLAEGAVVKNLEMTNANAVDALLTRTMRGSIVHHFNVSNITMNLDASQNLGFVTSVVETPKTTPYFHGYVDHVNASELVINELNGGWATSGSLISIIVNTPFRISNVNYSGTNNLYVHGSGAAVVLGTNKTGLWIEPGGLYGNISNVWMDKVEILSGTTLTSCAFTSSFVSVPGGGDVVSNSYSYATIENLLPGNGSCVGIAGISGTVEHGSSEPFYAVNSFFAGSLPVDAEGAIVGSNYSGGTAYLVNTRNIDTVTQPAAGSVSLLSSTNSVLTDAQFKTPSNFSTWLGSIWNLRVGFYPVLGTTMADLTNVDEISSGDNHMCALKNGTVKCWGYGALAMIGDGALQNRLTATSTLNLSDANHVAVGAWHSCATIGSGPDSGKVKCWGYDAQGQLGNGGASTSSTPDFVLNLTNVSQMAMAGYHSCALIGSGPDVGAVKCWGADAWGETGDGGAFAHQHLPVTAVASGASQVVAGYDNACAFMSSGINAGNIMCWGGNNYGQLLGLATYGSYSGPGSPVAIVGLGTSDVLQIALGDDHTCAVMNDRSVKCWGKNNKLQLGDGTMSDNLIPVTVLTSPGVPLANVDRIYLGRDHSCAVLLDKTVKCWGSNNKGQLGDGTTTNRSYAVTVQDDTDSDLIADGPLSDVGELATSGDFVCARFAQGTHAKKVKCWGGNPYGQLGNNTTVDSFVPVFVKEQ